MTGGKRIVRIKFSEKRNVECLTSQGELEEQPEGSATLAPPLSASNLWSPLA